MRPFFRSLLTHSGLVTILNCPSEKEALICQCPSCHVAHMDFERCLGVIGSLCINPEHHLISRSQIPLLGQLQEEAAAAREAFFMTSLWLQRTDGGQRLQPIFCIVCQA